MFHRSNEAIPLDFVMFVGYLPGQSVASDGCLVTSPLPSPESDLFFSFPRLSARELYPDMWNNNEQYGIAEHMCVYLYIYIIEYGFTLYIYCMHIFIYASHSLAALIYFGWIPNSAWINFGGGSYMLAQLMLMAGESVKWCIDVPCWNRIYLEDKWGFPK